MSNLPISSKYRSEPQGQVSDADRDDLTTRLNDAFTEGKLDEGTYRNLLDTTYAATRLGELAVVAEALPARKTYNEPAIVQQDAALPPGEVSTANRTPDRRALKSALAVAAGGFLLVGLILVILALLIL